jgi:hypothetical protein
MLRYADGCCGSEEGAVAMTERGFGNADQLASNGAPESFGQNRRVYGALKQRTCVLHRHLYPQGRVLIGCAAINPFALLR